MRSGIRRSVGVLVGSIGLAWSGCADDAGNPLDIGASPTAGPQPAGLVISEPMRGSVSGSITGLTGSAMALGEGQVAYVSAVPGSLPDALSVEIRNLTTGSEPIEPVPVVDGGFDPVPVLASAEDELELAVRLDDGGISYMRILVPIRRPPAVVRTSPKAGRTDVALSVRIQVVLSEPIDPESVTPTSVQLLEASIPVEASVGLAPDSPFTVELLSAVPLKPSTAYELVVTPELHDFVGEGLEQPVMATFTTESDLVTVQAVVGWDPITFEFNSYYSYRWYAGPDASFGDCPMNACPARRLTVSRISEPTTVVLEIVDTSGNGFEGVIGGTVPPGAVANFGAEWVGPTSESVLYQVSITLLDGRVGSTVFDSSP